MFAQVITGRVDDAGAVRELHDRWVGDLSPYAHGWLGATLGVTADGRFVAVVRFESAEAARHNSDRPEQGEWAAELRTRFLEGPVFLDSEDVDVDLQGDPAQAGFVQVIRGRVTDPQRARELMTQDEERWKQLRPDVLGSVTVHHGDGGYTTVVYFTDEAEARAGERVELPPELEGQWDELLGLEVGEPEFYDLTQPWLYEPN